MRWYDVEPDVYMAISMIECAELSRQIKYAKYIIAQLKEKDPAMDYIKKTTQSNIERHPYKRWYDKNETISLAFDYLKNSTVDLQREIARDVLTYINVEASFRY